MTEYFRTKELLKPPTERAAFSDRQAYVCAELSKLAYYKFEGGNTVHETIEIVRNIIGDDDRLEVLAEQLSAIMGSEPADAVKGRNALSAILAEVGFNLEEVFSKKGTQAFICTKSVERAADGEKVVAFLTFRGTEPREFADIKTDVKADLVPVNLSGELVEFHQGYWDAFKLVKSDIQKKLDELAIDQLFITGHSLGGALAVVATRTIASDSTGACYTFGAPPVGAVSVQNKLKTPVYQIVNEIDIVPRMPNPWWVAVVQVFLWGLKALGKVVTAVNAILVAGSWDEWLERKLNTLSKFRHPGYVSYLVGQGSAARLRYSVSSFDLAGWWVRALFKSLFKGFKKMLGDHSIDTYITKLSVHAMSRQTKTDTTPTSIGDREQKV